VVSLGFRHAKLDGFDYLVAEVFGLGSHFPMIAPRSMFMASAVELRQGEVCSIHQRVEKLHAAPLEAGSRTHTKSG